MLGTRHQLFQAILTTLARATPAEKRQLREALCGNRCQVCGEERRTLIHDNKTGNIFCFSCIGKPKCQPCISRERRELTRFDKEWLHELRVAWDERHQMTEGGYGILELLLVVAILLIISSLGTWKFMEALQAVSDLLALLK
jgi:hypothetical protein